MLEQLLIALCVQDLGLCLELVKQVEAGDDHVTVAVACGDATGLLLLALGLCLAIALGRSNQVELLEHLLDHELWADRALMR